MATKLLFEAGDYLIFGPKVDRCVDSTQCDYGGLRRVYRYIRSKKGDLESSSNTS